MGDEKINDQALRIQLARRKKVFRRFFAIAGIVVISVAAILGGIWYSRKRTGELPGAAYGAIGREHIGINDSPPAPYNSNPPSSGGHFGQSAKWGIYDYEVNDRIFLHNLEHGGVWISYRPTMSAAVVEGLAGIVNEFGKSKLVMAPRSANDADIAVASWGRALKINLQDARLLSENDKRQIIEFYKAFKNRGPEFVPDSAGGIDPKAVQ